MGAQTIPSAVYCRDPARRTDSTSDLYDHKPQPNISDLRHPDDGGQLFRITAHCLPAEEDHL